MKLLRLSVAFILSFSSLAGAQSYDAYNKLLKKYATSTGVKYKAWNSNAADKKALNQVLSEWSKIDAKSLGKNDRAAFRINLYNAAMIDVVLDRYPLKSVTKIGLPFSIFKKKIIETPEGKISLDTVEKGQLLKDFPDARVHFAVNCASVSCPPLRAEAYTGKKLKKQLDEQTRLFAKSSEAVRIKGSKAYYSKLFKWYKKDFGTSRPATYLNQFREEKISEKLKVKWISYDWGLNESKEPAKKAG